MDNTEIAFPWFILPTLVLCLPAGGHAELPRASNVPGGVAIIRLADHAPAEAAPKAWFQDRRVLVFRRDGGWHALVGLALTLKPGTHELRVQADGRATPVEPLRRFEVVSKHYPEQRLVIKDRRKVEPSAEDLERIAQEQRIINRVKANWREAAPVDLDFRLPSDGPLSSRFGMRRFFNNQPRNPHAGLDVAVPLGAPVRTAAAGVVSNTGDYFFNGNTVFVDHGMGLITMYCHLDRIDVGEGDELRPGHQIGIVGMTGRATGPHLHWSVILNGTTVDPELFIDASAGTPRR
jgi:murein DD-endopeptidase MepM/ murein hydrolase activator NlpD